MKISNQLTDEAILAELGARIAARRLELQLTQAEVAEQAGIAKRTLERMEAGHSVQMAGFIRIMRALEGLPGMDDMIPEAGPRPMVLLQRKGKPRQRVSKRRAPEASGKPWSWGDDT